MEEVGQKVQSFERVTGRKARDLQMEERGCIFISLKWQEEKTSDMFFLLYTNLKEGFS